MERAPVLRDDAKRTVLLMSLTQVPHLRIVDPDNAFFQVDLRIGGWHRLRVLADEAECILHERTVGLITRRFKITGDEDQMNRFLQLAWDDDILGLQFRTELRRMISKYPAPQPTEPSK
jgi:hypothetical protein